MTAEVNSAAAAVGCPHHNQKEKKQPAANEKDKNANANCGFSTQMRDMATHADGWEVSTDSSTIASRLSKHRVVSSIPKTNEYTPDHQSDNSKNWEYPSEEMYFKAMERKGWAPQAEEMKTIVAIHNTVNEQSWREVLKWERFHPSHEPPKLKRFMGKPTEYSPKARLMNMLGWSVLPFDRHDWVVDRDGKDVRYVIDFYSGQPEPGRPLSVYLDVRPALDSVESVVDRLRWQFNEKIRPLLPFGGAFIDDSSTSDKVAKSNNNINSKSAGVQQQSTVHPHTKEN